MLFGSLHIQSAKADELFSWWERGLLDFSMEPGEWVFIESREIDQSRTVVDSIRCDVLAAEGHDRWLGIETSRSEDSWVLRVDVEELRATAPLVEALRELYRISPAGEVRAEELNKLRESQLFRRRLEDPFEKPEIQREALADSTVGGNLVARNLVLMTEHRERRIPLGTRELHYSIELRSTAQMSAEIPVFGILRSVTVSRERTVHMPLDGGEPLHPPEIQELRRELNCLGFGRDEARGLPVGIH